MDFKKIIKYFVGGAVAGAICMFFIKLYFGTHWDWDSDDIQTIITFGFTGLLFLLPLKNKKTNSTIMKLKDFIYNKKTKESNLFGVLFVVVVTIVSGAVLYYGFWI